MISVQAMLIGWFSICVLIAIAAEVIVKRQERQKSQSRRGNDRKGVDKVIHRHYNKGA